MEIKQLIKKWKGNKRYTLKFVDLVDEEDLKFKPIDGAKTYQLQLSHITTWMRTHSRFITGTELEKSSTKTKEDIAKNLEEFFDRILSFLENTNASELAEIVEMWYGKVSRESILLTMDNHLSHHRGQLVVYLRMMGIKSPSYVGW
ncbi:DinB family protein [Spongiimicrobium sp. 2-473A-2-J]|uniref:DinB family protein n=1 Tax=Eudoraea algarum TaxID=3417568 RepID=UPI003D35E666